MKKKAFEFKQKKDEIGKLDRDTFGKELMISVADKLEKGFVMQYTHRDYCGHGLRFNNNKFELFVHDDYNIIIKMEWPSRDDFIDFFSVQSDYSLSGADKAMKELHEKDPFFLNNQRITRKRLADFTDIP
jgi:hypothetical protein